MAVTFVPSAFCDVLVCRPEAAGLGDVVVAGLLCFGFWSPTYHETCFVQRPVLATVRKGTQVWGSGFRGNT